MNLRLLALCRYGFYLSVLLLFYGTLFPFHFDFSLPALTQAWSQFGFIPFWDVARGRIHSLPDMLSNALLTFPMGFFGILWFGRERKLRGLLKWFLLGFVLGLLSEVIQLAIPSRMSDITDALNNGLGAFAGAAFASLFGARIIDLLSGSLLDKRSTNFLILTCVAMASMLLPFDFGMDVSHVGSSLRNLWENPWESGIPIQNEWVQLAVFLMIGAAAALISKSRVVLFALVLPFILESMQFLVESHAPSARDVVMNFAGVAAGIAAARTIPNMVCPTAGFVLMNAALIAQGLSPYHFGAPSHFEWIPLVEYYNQTTGSALYDAMAGILSYGLLAALWPRKTTILWSIALSAGIEFAQIFIPTRYAGITDVAIAGIGAWAGYMVSKALTSEPGDWLPPPKTEFVQGGRPLH